MVPAQPGQPDGQPWFTRVTDWFSRLPQPDQAPQTPPDERAQNASTGSDQPQPEESPSLRPLSDQDPPAAGPANHREPGARTWRDRLSGSAIAFAGLVLFIALLILSPDGIVIGKPPQRGRVHDETQLSLEPLPQPDDKIPNIVIHENAKREPLPLFHDLSALYRSWATFSTWVPLDTGVLTRPNDQFDFEPIFSKLLQLGNIYELDTGKITNSKHPFDRRAIPSEDLQDLSTATSIDLHFLEHQVADCMKALQSMSNEEINRANWKDHVEMRLLNLVRKSKLEAALDPRADILKDDELWEDFSQLPTHHDTIDHIKFLQHTSWRHPRYGRLEDVAVDSTGGGQLYQTMEVLQQARSTMRTLNQIVAHSSGAYLYGASRGKRRVWKFLEIFAAPFGEDAPLYQAVKLAEGVENIADEQATIAQTIDQIDGLVAALNRIIACEQAIDRHLDALEQASSSGDGVNVSDGQLSYAWSREHQAWVTERKASAPGEQRTFKDHGQPECRSLFDFERGHPATEVIYLTPDGKSKSEQVLQFVPAPKYLLGKYDDDLAYVLEVAGSKWL